MPLPEQFVDRLNRESLQTPGWSGQLLMFSSTAFFVSLAVYAGLIFGYKPYLQGEVSKLDSQIKAFGLQIPPEEQDKLISFYSQIINLQSILNNHVISSRIFPWIEKNTQANVYYNKMALSAQTNQLNLAGNSKTVKDFTDQIVIFQNDPLVKRIVINSFSAATGGLWQFDVTLFMADNALIRASQ